MLFQMSAGAIAMARWLLPIPGAGSQFPHQEFVNGRVGEVVDVLGEWKLGDAELIANGAGLLLGDLRLQEFTDDARRFVLPLDSIARDLVAGAAHLHAQQCGCGEYG